MGAFTIIQGKEGSTPKKPLFLVQVTAPDLDTVYLTTAASYGAPNIVWGPTGGPTNTYLARIKESSFSAIQAMSPQGYDSLPGFTLTLADADQFLWINHIQAHGWRGSTITLTIVLWDVVANAYSTDAIQSTFIGGKPQRVHAKGEVTVECTSATNFTRIKVPSVGIEYRCPWVFPSTADQRYSAANDPTSIYYQCGYSPDQTGGVGNDQSPGVPFKTCDLTRSSPADLSVGCMARLGDHTRTSVAPDGDLTQDLAGRPTGRFGGVTWLAPQSFTGRQYVSGQKTFGFNQPNPAIAGGYYNWVYGTQWVDCQVLAPVGDPNSNRAEAAVCFAPFGAVNVQKLLVNGVEVPFSNSDQLFTWRYTTQGGRNGALQGDNGFNKQADPHGSLCVVEFVVPEELSQPGSVPSVQALVTSGPLLNCYPIASASGSGGEITITLPAGVSNLNLGAGMTCVIAGNSWSAANGPFTVDVATSGPPGTIKLLGTSATGSGTGGGVFFFRNPDLQDGTGGAAANLAFVVMDLLTWGNIPLSQIDALSFYNAAQICATTLSYKAADGTTQTHAQFKASFALQGNARQVLSQVLLGLRNAGNLMIAPQSSTGLIQCYIRQTLADQQPAPIAGSNYNTPVASPHADSTTAAPDIGNGYYAYLFDETNIEEGSFRITSTPIASTPNTVSVQFQDENNQYQRDSLTEIDPQSYTYSGNQEVQVPVQILGAPNFDQLTRIANVQLAEALYGNSLDNAGGTEYYEFTCNHRVLHLLSHMGYICGLRFRPEGIGVSAPQAVRILSLQPQTDGEKWNVKAAFHSDDWYTYAYGQDPTPYQNNPTVPGSSRPPYPWRAAQTAWGSGDALFPNQESFNVAIDTSSYPAQITIAGTPVVNVQPNNGKPPLVPLQASVSNSGGTIKTGTYHIAFSVNGAKGPVSKFITAVVPVGVTTGSITVSGIQWQSGAAPSIQPFVGPSVFAMRAAAGASYSGSAADTNGNPTTYTFTSITPDGVGLPDINASGGYLIEEWGIIHGGVWGDAITSLSGSVLTFSAGAWSTNQWAGYVLSLYYRPGAATQPSLNVTVSSSTATTLTMSASGFLAGDVVVMRPKASSITSNTIGDANFANSYSGAGLTANAERGNLIFIIAGTGARQAPKTIASNTSTVFTIQGSWDTTPDATSIFIVLDPTVAYSYYTQPAQNDGAVALATIASTPAVTAKEQSLLISVSPIDSDDNSAPWRFQAMREVYVPPQQSIVSPGPVAAPPSAPPPATITVAEVGGSRKILSDQSTHDTIQVTSSVSLTGMQTIYFSWDGGANWQWQGWYSFASTTSVQIDFLVRTQTESGGLTSNNFKAYLAAGTIPGGPSLIATASLPAGGAMSPAITVVISAPVSSGATFTITNLQGAAPTSGTVTALAPSNIYMGTNSLQNPYWSVVINITTPGNSDPNTWFYWFWVEWCDSLGNPISPGGVSNPNGWEPGDQFANIGGTQQWELDGNYPAPGVDGYLKISCWGFDRNFTTGVAPFTGNADAVLQAGWAGAATSFLLHVGPPPITMTGPGMTNAPSTGNPDGAPATSTQNAGHSLLQDWNFNLTPAGVVPGNAGLNYSKWLFGWDAANTNGYTSNAGSLEVRNDGGSSTGGIQNYLRLTGPNSSCQQNIQIPSGNAFYAAFTARSNNPTISVVSLVTASGTGVSYANGVYPGVALNGLGGTGALATVTISGNVVTNILITNQGGSYTANGSFTVSLTVGGGHGITLTCYTGAHGVSLAITAFDANSSVVLVNGNTTNYLSISGSVASWTSPAASAILLMPANVSYVNVQVFCTFTNVPTSYWDVSDIMLQVVPNQTLTSAAQINSAVPQAQTGGQSAVSASSTSTSAGATYGQIYAQITASNGCSFTAWAASIGSSVGINGGSGGSGANFTVAGAGGSGQAQLNMTGPASNYGLQVIATSSSLQISAISGGVGFIGASGTISYTKPGGTTGAINIKNGIIYSWT